MFDEGITILMGFVLFFLDKKKNQKKSRTTRMAPPVCPANATLGVTG